MPLQHTAPGSWLFARMQAPFSPNSSHTMVKSGLALAALLSVAAGLQRAAAVEVATPEGFLAALKANAKLIEVTDHLILNTGDALDVANEVGDDPDISPFPGFLIRTKGARLTIKVRSLSQITCCDNKYGCGHPICACGVDIFAPVQHARLGSGACELTAEVM